MVAPQPGRDLPDRLPERIHAQDPSKSARDQYISVPGAGVNPEGHTELLGLWLAETEGAKFWLSVLTEIKTRGLRDTLIACVERLKGFPDAIAAEYPDTKSQLCRRRAIAHIGISYRTAYRNAPETID